MFLKCSSKFWFCPTSNLVSEQAPIQFSNKTTTNHHPPTISLRKKKVINAIAELLTQSPTTTKLAATTIATQTHQSVSKPLQDPNHNPTKKIRRQKSPKTQVAFTTEPPKAKSLALTSSLSSQESIQLKHCEPNHKIPLLSS